MACGDEKAGQRNHRVAAPVAKPVIARDDGTSVGIAGQLALHDELVRVQHQLLDPDRRGRSQLVRILPSCEKRVLQAFAFGETFYSIEFSVRVRRQNEGGTLSLLELQTKDSGKEVVLAGIEAAILLKRQKIIAVPVVPRFDGDFAARKIEGGRSVERSNFDPIPDVFDLHLPIAGVRRGMVVAVVDERFAFKFQDVACPDQGVLHKRGVLPLSHPNAFLKQRITDRESPNGRCALQMKALDVHVAFRFNRAAHPPICREWKIFAVVTGCFIEFRNHLRSPDRWVEGGEQESVVAAGQIAADRSGGEAADSVGDEPLALFRLFEGAAGFAAETDSGDPRHAYGRRFAVRHLALLRRCDGTVG